MSGRPSRLDDIVSQSMHQITTATSHREQSNRTLASARQFRQTAQLCRDEQLLLPVISNLHEAARLAITAVAAANGLRFANRSGAHVAVVDYAFGVKLVNRTEWTQLDELRDLRHKTNYPSDLIEPGATELDQFTHLTDIVIARSQHVIAPIPPPPTRH